ncbi:SDR family NAD(P)-dependent oxidoreductase [Actinomadura rugatobispora]|uniref:SDR family NAD(P)-dependent oxidoreductase n=1 Tax=Actinomadura rugatobispora TaxID=1994 RepID=A0ABW1A3W1_9ACTN|nr:SDR family oxidoreductase [Actinomadura rugatobispora]
MNDSDADRRRSRAAALPLRGDRLRGRTALVAGGGGGPDPDFLGTGAATALLFAAQGATVGVMDVSAERAEWTCALIGRQGGRALPLVADVTSEEEVERAARSLVAEAGRLDVLVNNTGITGGAVDAPDTREWDRVVEVNLRGTMLTCRAALPHLRASGGGSIVNVSSAAAVRAFGSGAYGASKAGVIALTADLAYAWGRFGIRVNCLVPGHLHTPIGDRGGDEARETRRKANLLQVEGCAWDIAWAALFLAGDESGWITAATLPVDAGSTAATVLGMLPLM